MRFAPQFISALSGGVSCLRNYNIMPRRRIIILITGLILIIGALTPMLVFGQDEKDLSIKLSGVFGEAVSGLPEYIAKIYNYAIGLAVSLAIFMLMVGGFFWITAAGDRGKIEKAKGMMGDAVIGLILTISAYLILNTINPAILSLKMPKIEKITGVPWEGEMCATRPEDCPQGKTPINCQCVDPEDLQVGGWCLVGDMTEGDARCAKQCQDCVCHPPPPKTCVELLAGGAAQIAGIAMAGAVFVYPGEFSAFVNTMKNAGAQTAKVFYKGGKLFFKIPGVKQAAGVTFALAGAAEICRQGFEGCRAATEDAAIAIGLEQIEAAVKKWIGNVTGTLGICYATAQGTVQNGGFCGRDENCQSGICVPFDPDQFKKKFEAKEENWCDRFFEAKKQYLSKLGLVGKAIDWTQNRYIDVLETIGGSAADLAKVVIGCDVCGTILGGMGVCSSGEVGGSCWVGKDKDGKEKIYGCKEGLKCIRSGGTWWGTGGVLMACSDGSEGSACQNNDDCQKGLKCEDFGGGIKKCEKEGEGWQGAPCVDNGGCKEDKFPPKSYLAKAAGINATVGCINVREGGLEDFIVNKFLEPTKYNKGKPGRCGRNGYEVGDPCFIPGTTTGGRTGGCNLFSGITPKKGQSFICMIKDDKSGKMRRYTEEDQRNGYWGKCCVYDRETGEYECKASSK